MSFFHRKKGNVTYDENWGSYNLVVIFCGGICQLFGVGKELADFLDEHPEYAFINGQKPFICLIKDIRL
jgi:hypothetical protein